jgi:hypothetical protein
MKIGLKFVALAVALTLGMSGSAFAQYDVDGPNAALRIQGQDPGVADPADHDVLVGLPGLCVWEVITGANQRAPIIFIASLVDPTTGSTLTGLPWGGSLDIGNPTGGIPSQLVLWGDGLGLTNNPVLDIFFASDDGNALLGLLPTFTLALPVNTLLNNFQVASQCIVRDVTAPPFFLDNTQAGSAEFLIGQTLLALTGDDGAVNIPFVVGNSFELHGTNFPDIWINGNGYVNFGGFSTVPAAGFTNDDVGAINAEPAIFIGMTDWSIDGFGFGDGVLHEELGTNLRVSWGDPVAHSQGGCPHFADIDSNTFEIVMQLQDGALSNPNAGQFQLNPLVLDPTAVIEFGNGLIGHTPGGAAINPASAVDMNLRTAIGFGVGGDAQVEEHDFDTFAQTRIGWNGAGARRGYNNYTINWNGNSTLFLPNGGAPAGVNGYTSIPLGALPQDDFVGIDLASIQNAGGQTVTATGSFFGFDPAGAGAGTIVLDAGGAFGGPYMCAVLGILDGTGQSGPLSIANPQPGPHRDGQGLQFLTPALGASGTYTLDITFASGPVFNTSVTVTAPGLIIQNFTLPDDGFMNVALTVPVNYYSQVFNSLFINSNGFVTFVAGSGDFTDSAAEFFNGWFTAGNEGVAVTYTDLNSGGTFSGATYQTVEDTINGTVAVNFINQNHWDTGAPAGNFNCTFNALGVPGSVTIDHTGFLPDVNPNANFGTGVTDGVTSAGTDIDFTGTGGFGPQLGVYVSANPAESLYAQTAPGVAPSAPFINMLDIGGGNGMWAPF